MGFNIPEVVYEKFGVLINIIKDVALGLGKGRSESIYQNAIIHELQALNIKYTREETVSILYKGYYVGQERLDIAINEWLGGWDLIIELKAVTSDIKPEHYWQIISYMEWKNCNYGLIVNYNQSPNKNLSYMFVVIENGRPYMYDYESKLAVEITDYKYSR
jgi:GxxExxY protein